MLHLQTICLIGKPRRPKWGEKDKPAREGIDGGKWTGSCKTYHFPLGVVRNDVGAIGLPVGITFVLDVGLRYLCVYA